MSLFILSLLNKKKWILEFGCPAASIRIMLKPLILWSKENSVNYCKECTNFLEQKQKEKYRREQKKIIGAIQEIEQLIDVHKYQMELQIQYQWIVSVAFMIVLMKMENKNTRK